MVSKTEDNEGFGGLLKRLATKSHTVYSREIVGKDVGKTHAKLSASIDILKYNCMLESWPGCKAVKK